MWVWVHVWYGYPCGYGYTCGHKYTCVYGYKCGAFEETRKWPKMSASRQDLLPFTWDRVSHQPGSLTSLTGPQAPGHSCLFSPITPVDYRCGPLCPAQYVGSEDPSLGSCFPEHTSDSLGAQAGHAGCSRSVLCVFGFSPGLHSQQNRHLTPSAETPWVQGEAKPSQRIKDIEDRGMRGKDEGGALRGQMLKNTLYPRTKVPYVTTH